MAVPCPFAPWATSTPSSSNFWSFSELIRSEGGGYSESELETKLANVVVAQNVSMQDASRHQFKVAAVENSASEQEWSTLKLVGQHQYKSSSIEPF
jgi:hypothetical protein